MRAAPPLRAPSDPRPAATPPPAVVGAAGASGEPRIDPRLTARRIAVRRDEGRRRLRRLTWVGGAVVAVAVVLGSTRTPLLDLDRIAVTGARHLGDDAVRAALADAGVRPGRPLVDLDLGRAEAALESLPAVQAADVERRWPGTVEVTLTERRPVAVVAHHGGQAIVGADGVVIAVQAAPAGLVLVDGPPTLAPGDRLDAPELLAVAAALPPSLVPLISGIGAGDGAGGAGDDPVTVELRLVAGGVVRLGTVDQLGPKLQAVETVLTQVDVACLAVLDVRVPSPATVTRRSGC